MALTPIIACLLFGCATPPPTAGTGQPLLDRPEFEKCELDAFMALNIARSHFYFNQSKDRLLATAGVHGPSQKGMIEDLFKKVDAGEIKNHASFASGRFYGCMRSQRVALKENQGGATVCLARQDILFLAMLEKQQRSPVEKAIVNTKQRLSDRTIYPEKLIEGLTPMLYAADDRTDDEFALRQFVFESCLFPDEWKAKHPVAGTDG